MPRIEFRTDRPATIAVDALAVFATKGDDGASPGADAQAVGDALDLDIAAELRGIAFDGALGSVARIPTRGGLPAPVVLVVGLGDAGDVTLETLRKGAGAAARNAAKDSTLALVVPGDAPGEPAAAGQAVAEGARLGAYAFTEYRTKTHDSPSLESILILPGEDADAAAIEDGVRTGVITATATCLARDLVNTPPFAKRPPALADRVADVARNAGVAVRIRDEQALADEGFGGILGVGQGSSAPPRLVELTWEPEGAEGHVVLVGKGITFDTGGVSLKPTQAMSTMKMDMAGAATVTAVMAAVAQLGAKVKVTALMALAENMVSGEAYRVSDVLTHRNGKTVEVLNTDAEGRLVMADALAYGAELEPDVMIDIATLTGAQVIALGSKITGLMGTDEDVLSGLEAAGEATGEPVWRLPLPQEYREHLDSSVADLKNIGKGREAGTVIAGLFLKEFTADLPWAHLDIAGPAWDDSGDGMLHGKGGTGACVRLLTRYLADLAEQRD